RDQAAASCASSHPPAGAGERTRAQPGTPLEDPPRSARRGRTRVHREPRPSWRLRVLRAARALGPRAPYGAKVARVARPAHAAAARSSPAAGRSGTEVDRVIPSHASLSVDSVLDLLLRTRA